MEGKCVEVWGKKQRRGDVGRGVRGGVGKRFL